MTKPIDPGRLDPDYNKLETFLRGMTRETIQKRFGFDPDKPESARLVGFPCCPECGAPTEIKKVVLHEGTLTVYFLQCTVEKKLNDHGFGKFSKHGTRAPMGRKGGEKPAPTPMPEPIPSPAPVPVPIPDRVVHPECIRAFRYVANGDRQIYFVGPAGTGKSTMTEHLLEMMRGLAHWKEAALFLTTVSQGTFAADLAGFLDRLDGGKYVTTGLVESLRGPNLTVVDEADKGNPNLAGFWNTVLANNRITTPGGTFDRHPDNVVVFIGNTTGHSPSKQYSGSVRQDFATLDRFRCFNVLFDEKVERAAVPGLSEELYRKVTSIRKNAQERGLQRIVGLRWLKRVNTVMNVEGKGAKDALLQTMRDECWSDDEILASGVNETEVKSEAKSTSKYY